MYLSQITVLVVDDEPQIRQLVGKFLQMLCKEVFIKDSGQSAWQCYENNAVDLVLTDIRMPHINGIQLLEMIKQNDAEQIVVLFSGSNDIEFLTQAINLGADQFFNKPLDFNRMKEQLELLAKKIVATKENERYKKLLKQRWDIDQSSYKSLINEFEQYLELIDETNCIRRYDLDGNVTFYNEKLAKKVHPDTMQSAFEDSCQNNRKFNINKLQNYLETKSTFKDIIKHRLPDKEIYLDTAVIKLRDKNGNDKGYLELGYDVSKIFTLNKELGRLSDEVIYMMGSMAESRSLDTARHLERVTQYVKILAKYTDLSDEQRTLLVRATPLHDIGKIAISNSLLQKPGKLDKEEFERIKEHTTIGHSILCSVDNEIFTAAATIALTHHERWDGKGYPLGLEGEEIDFMGRLVGIVDVFDALTSKRSYKDAWSIEKSLDIIKPERAKQFDPLVHDLFFEHIDEILDAKEAVQSNNHANA